MKKIYSFLTFGTLIFLLLLIPARADDDVILFFGEGCPHCEEVKREITNKELDKKVNIDMREVYNDRENVDLFRSKLEVCGLESGGVPTLYLNKACYVGTIEVVEALEKYSKQDVLGESTNKDESIIEEDQTPTSTEESDVQNESQMELDLGVEGDGEVVDSGQEDTAAQIQEIEDDSDDVSEGIKPIYVFGAIGIIGFVLTGLFVLIMLRK